MTTTQLEALARETAANYGITVEAARIVIRVAAIQYALEKGVDRSVVAAYAAQFA